MKRLDSFRMPGNQIECAEITDHSPTQAATLLLHERIHDDAPSQN